MKEVVITVEDHFSEETSEDAWVVSDTGAAQEDAWDTAYIYAEEGNSLADAEEEAEDRRNNYEELGYTVRIVRKV